MSNVAIISTVKAPLRELHMFINYHLNIGIDKIILFFDDPHDVGARTLSHHRQIITVACSSEYWLTNSNGRPDSLAERQLVNVNVGAQIARSQGCQWIVHIDHDELINPLTDFKRVLADCRADAVKFHMLEAVPEREKYDNIYIPTLFREKPTRVQLLAAKICGCTSSFHADSYFRGHTASKMAFNVNSKIIEFGVHGPNKCRRGTSIKNARSIRLLHYDCIGIDVWKSKWDRRIDASGKVIDFSVMSRTRAEQFRTYRQTKQTGIEELSRLYTRLYMIPEHEKAILFRLGMLKEIKLDRTLFENQVTRADI